MTLGISFTLQQASKLCYYYIEHYVFPQKQQSVFLIVPTGNRMIRNDDVRCSLSHIYSCTSSFSLSAALDFTLLKIELARSADVCRDAQTRCIETLLAVQVALEKQGSRGCVEKKGEIHSDLRCCYWYCAKRSVCQLLGKRLMRLPVLCEGVRVEWLSSPAGTMTLFSSVALLGGLTVWGLTRGSGYEAWYAIAPSALMCLERLVTLQSTGDSRLGERKSVRKHISNNELCRYSVATHHRFHSFSWVRVCFLFANKFLPKTALHQSLSR